MFRNNLVNTGKRELSSCVQANQSFCWFRAIPRENRENVKKVLESSNVRNNFIESKLTQLLKLILIFVILILR